LENVRPISDEIKPENKIRVLILEDQINLRKALRRILEQQKVYHVEEFNTSREAIGFLKENHIDLIVSDIFLARGSGWDVLYYVRGRSVASDIPILFVSGQASKEDVVLSLQQGVNGYLLKPFETTDLIEKVRQIWEEYKNPTVKSQLLRKAEKAFLDKKISEAVRLYDEVTISDPDSIKAMVGLAKCLFEQGEIEESKVTLQAAIDSSPNFWPAYASLADVYLACGQEELAIEFILKELELHSKQPQRRIQLAKVYFKLDLQAEGFEQARLALLANLKNEETLLFLAESYLKFGKLEKSLHYFLKTRRILPQSILALEGIIKVCRSAGNLKKAIQILGDFINNNRGQKELYWYRSKLWMELGINEKALLDTETIIRLDGEHFPAQTQKTQLLIILEQYEKAVQNQQKILEKWKTPDAISLLGHAHFKNKSCDLAIQTFQMAHAMQPTNTRLMFNIGSTYEELKRWTDAQYWYQKVQSNANPKSVEYLEASQRLQRIPKQVS
jgi:DNA-binding response OmpR family regulator